MITLCALLLTLAGATLVYLASEQQRLLASPLRAGAKVAGWLLVGAGTAGWWHAAGMGPGITAALTAVMLMWVTLPYVAWWRTSTTKADGP
ncbi:hypothetical protein [Dyella telluris]|uniref:DUF3325 domain-containing protein n=1 Tax=Dyella telluris TaxID=2763498 RepID=A0A7G8Q2T6_9GAMM|nr:hypothetical protein [Dyella telluris]QNK01094.1 hypothetical protein H8F01_18845 [Dyella telluris]